MIPDELFGECLVILQDSSVLEEDQADRISQLISSKTSLESNALENEVLDVLWRHRNKSSPTSSPPIRNNHTIIRRASPAPWQFARVGSPSPSLGTTPPMAPPGFPPSLRGSPFPSPRPSPRLAYSSPLIPHSPTLNNYEPALPSVGQDTNNISEPYGDYGSDTVSWLIGDDNSMIYSRGATENMSPHDMLRSVLGEGRSDEEIDQALDACSYDLGATLTMLMDQQQQANNLLMASEPAVVIGKSTTPNPERSRPLTPRNGVVCRFFLSTGQCLRADCRFSHDLGTTICKYWLMGSCLAGDTCIFSHDPTMSVSKMTLDSNSRTSTPPPHFSFQDSTAFPSLSHDQWGGGGPGPSSVRERDVNASLVPPVDDADAFPTLSSVTSNPHKKRGGRQKSDIPTGPSSLAEVVRMAPTPSSNSNRTSASPSNRWSGAHSSPSSKRGARSSAAQIPAPQQIPWLDTGSAINSMYLKFRKEALSHGVLRAKYLQMASSAWQRNDAKAAKEHSRKANNANMAMVKSHKEAAKAIYEERNKQAANGAELFIDLHGLLPDEAVKYLEDILLTHQSSSRPVYAIVGTGHHSKGGKDKLSRVVRTFLDEWKYAYREFSATADRNSYGGIIAIDPSSHDKTLRIGPESGAVSQKIRPSSGGSINGKKDPPKGPGKKK
ncbi:hypothetical protein EDC01DRAFT_613695 [Geopyxis carbonaria]|nr:hypothetical protein EDC01DRAFT_613695 [Geopyxis carbonaria]